jgi:hypothetical protein
VKAVLLWNLVSLGAVSLLFGQIQTKFIQSALTLGVHMATPCQSEAASAPMQVTGTSKRYCFQRRAVVDQTHVVSAAFDQQTYDNRQYGSFLKVMLPSASER